MNTVPLTCIGCPMGCMLEVRVAEGHAVAVAGNLCGRGKRYAQEEIACPARTLTTTVHVTGAKRKTVAVKTNQTVPKDAIFACVTALKDVRVEAPIQMGQVLVRNLAGTGADLVAAGAIS